MAGIFDIIGNALNPIRDIVSEVVVDRDQRDRLTHELQKAQLDAALAVERQEHERMVAQIGVNNTEAQHASLFVAGWRPAVGWISAGAVAYTFLLMPLMAFIARVVFGYGGEFPILETEQLMLLLAGMLGIAGFRSYEIRNGVNRDTLSGPRQGGREPNPTTASPLAAQRTAEVAGEVPPGFGTPLNPNNLPEEAPWSR